ncbi:hypothetical protein J8M21_25590 [Pseudoalteromonas luteoviolacea]|uniref:hypothetical protein n=1 Tax=Pseudoalteromonas luteoviolacea TaxID=43657 RepID=UPI001B3A791D|nr:hypothetical protein [Pseudoalteromonas luteoviolacea]MBQ4880576.1 hypothetical protein [Pseudoalteromonas luteoviolacea]MBQ4909623.1 hypothetical protein [Pseudoalteromonas luteoviolacea]
MFSLFKKKKFEPNFPIIELDASAAEVKDILSKFSSVVRVEQSQGGGVDFEYVAENHETRINVGFSADKILFVNYLSEQFNNNDKKKAQKLDWFINYYGTAEEFEEPNDTGFMIFFHNPKRKLTIVFGLHMGPIRINSHVNA